MGRGLRSLIPETPPPRPADSATRRGSEPAKGTPEAPDPARVAFPQIDIDRIVPNRRQPREQFDEAAIEALARSLKADGMLQPILVRPLADGKFGLVAGERRWRAAQRAGLLKVPAVVREIPDDRLLEFALIENLQREELNPIEEARAYRTLVDEIGLTQAQVAERIGKQRASVANTMRLLGLPEPVQKLLRSGALSMGHARALLGLGMATDQTALAERTVRDGLSVRDVEAEVARLGRTRTAMGETTVRTPSRRDPNVVAAEESLQRALATKVRIQQNKAGKGRVEIHFFSGEELNRVFDLLLRTAKGKA